MKVKGSWGWGGVGEAGAFARTVFSGPLPCRLPLFGAIQMTLQFTKYVYFSGGGAISSWPLGA